MALLGVIEEITSAFQLLSFSAGKQTQVLSLFLCIMQCGYLIQFVLLMWKGAAVLCQIPGYSWERSSTHFIQGPDTSCALAFQGEGRSQVSCQIFNSDVTCSSLEKIVFIMTTADFSRPP